MIPQIATLSVCLTLTFCPTLSAAKWEALLPSDHLSAQEYQYLQGLGYDRARIDLIGRLKKAIEDAIKGLDFGWPKSDREWNILAKQLRDELLDLNTLTELFVPGYGDIKSALIKYSQGRYLSASFDFAVALVDLLPQKKLAGLITEVAVKVRKAVVVFGRIRRLRKIDATFIDRMPDHWRKVASDSGEGVFWRNPNNPGRDHIRVMPGDPKSPWPSQREPYVKRHTPHKGFLDKYGNRADHDSPDSHIPWKDFKEF